MSFDENRVLNEVKLFAKNLTHYSETAQLDLFLACYADLPEFLAVSGDGMVRNHDELKKICKDYYGNLKEQKLTTVVNIILFLMDPHCHQKYLSLESLNVNKIKQKK